MSLMNGADSTVPGSTINVVCLALVAIMKVRVAAEAVGIDEEAVQNQ